MKKLFRAPIRTFVDGLLAVLPVALTVAVIIWVASLIDQFVGMLDRKEKTDLQTMSPVWCFFGGEGGTAVLALLPTPEQILLGGHPCHVIMVPTAPVPFGGALFFVPTEWVKPASFGVEGLTSIYVSMGISAPQYFSGSPQASSKDNSSPHL